MNLKAIIVFLASTVSVCQAQAANLADIPAPTRQKPGPVPSHTSSVQYFYQTENEKEFNVIGKVPSPATDFKVYFSLEMGALGDISVLTKPNISFDVPNLDYKIYYVTINYWDDNIGAEYSYPAWTQITMPIYKKIRYHSNYALSEFMYSYDGSIYARAFPSSLVKSSNDGETWSYICEIPGYPGSYAIDSKGYLYLSDWPTPKVSRDGGHTFEPMSNVTLPTQYSFWHPAWNVTELLPGTHNSFPDGAIFLSTYANSYGSGKPYEEISSRILYSTDTYRKIWRSYDFLLESPDFIHNGGFESGDTFPDPWSRWSSDQNAVLDLDYAVIHTGHRSAVIKNPAGANSAWGQTFSNVIEGQRYKFEGWIKTTNIDAQGGGAYYFLYFYDGNDVLLSVSAFDERVKGTVNWKRVEKTLTIPPGTRKITLEARVIGSSGTAWFDDIKVYIGGKHIHGFKVNPYVPTEWWLSQGGMEYNYLNHRYEFFGLYKNVVSSETDMFRNWIEIRGKYNSDPCLPYPLNGPTGLSFYPDGSLLIGEDAKPYLESGQDADGIIHIYNGEFHDFCNPYRLGFNEKCYDTIVYEDSHISFATQLCEDPNGNPDEHATGILGFLDGKWQVLVKVHPILIDNPKYNPNDPKSPPKLFEYPGNFARFGNDSRKLIPDNKKVVFVEGLGGIRFALPYITNGGFESGNIFPDNWFRWSSDHTGQEVLDLDYEVKHTGNRSAVIKNPAGANSVWAQSFKGITAGRNYKCTGWIKTDELDPKGGGGYYFMLFYDNNDEVISVIEFDERIRGTTDWTRVEKVFAVPCDTTSVTLEARVISSAGTAWFDDVTLIDEDIVIPFSDIDHDGDVDIADYVILANQWFQLPAVPSADIAPDGGDGIVDFWDLDMLADHWLEGTTP